MYSLFITIHLWFPVLFHWMILGDVWEFTQNSCRWKSFRVDSFQAQYAVAMLWNVNCWWLLGILVFSSCHPNMKSVQEAGVRMICTTLPGWREDAQLQNEYHKWYLGQVLSPTALKVRNQKGVRIQYEFSMPSENATESTDFFSPLARCWRMESGADSTRLCSTAGQAIPGQRPKWRLEWRGPTERTFFNQRKREFLFVAEEGPCGKAPNSSDVKWKLLNWRIETYG